MEADIQYNLSVTGMNKHAQNYMLTLTHSKRHLQGYTEKKQQFEKNDLLMHEGS